MAKTKKSYTRFEARLQSTLMTKCTQNTEAAHMRQRAASSAVNCEPDSVGGSYSCNALLHTRICPCHDRVLQDLLLSGVQGLSRVRFHLCVDKTNR